MHSEFRGKRILVTGGTGSIGSVIVQELLKYDPYQIRVFSRDETKQFDLDQKLGNSSKVSFLLGDIRDRDRLNLAMENIDIVFHVAALKHVVSCERNPFEAVKTNVQGTQNLIDCAFANNVDRVIGVSTDKATDPTNVMGCTKLLAEKIMLASYFYKGHKKTKFSYVRFGNVLGSRGSVLPLFMKQIKSGGPLTITDPEMTRFFMTIREAVDLVLKSSILMQDREIIVLKMPVMTIGDLAQATIQYMKDTNSEIANKEIELNIIGKKDGERKHEKLLTEEESENALETDTLYIITPNAKFEDPDFEPNVCYANATKARLGSYSSNKEEKISIDKIKDMIKKAVEENPDIYNF